MEMPDTKEKAQTNSKKKPFAEIGRKFKNWAAEYLLSGFAVATGCLILFLWLAEEVFEGQKLIFDEAVRQAVHQIAEPWLTQVMIGISFAGSGLFLTIGTVVISIIFILLKWRNAFLLLPITMVGALFLDFTLKLFFQRLRPEPFFNYPLPASYSFPSGHSLASFCFYGTLALLITDRIKNPKLKILIWVLSAVFVFLIGVSRIYLGVHFPSDVLAGFAAAFVWISTVAFVDQRLRKRKAEDQKASSSH